MELTEEKIFEDIQNLIQTCFLYTQLKSKPFNPFVKKLGESEEEIELIRTMKTLTERLLPLVTDEGIESVEITEE